MIRYHVVLTAKDGSNIRCTVDASNPDELEIKTTLEYPSHSLKVKDQVQINKEA